MAILIIRVTGEQKKLYCFVFLVSFQWACGDLVVPISSPSVCDQPEKNPLKFSAAAGNGTRATERTDSEAH